MISQPETYTTTPPPLPDYEVKFMPLKARLGNSVEWAFSAGTTGDFELRGILSGLDRASREEIMQNLTEVAYVSIPHKTNLSRNLDLALFKFRDDREAAVMMAALQKIVLQRHKDMDRNSRLRMRNMQEQPYAVAGGVTGIQWHYELEALLLGKTSNTELIAKQGNSVILLTETDSGLSATKIDAFLSRAFGLFSASPQAAPAATL